MLSAEVHQNSVVWSCCVRYHVHIDCNQMIDLEDHHWYVVWNIKPCCCYMFILILM